jgi:beta-fructofuranosidase
MRGNDGTWHLFYSALSEAEDGRVQRIGRADSQDLLTWIRHGSGPLVEADERWYETLETASWPGESWRDPFVLRDPAGDGWHMLIRARGKQGDRFDRGVIGHAWSADLGTWEVRPPLSQPSGFGQLEVPATVHVDGRWLLLFCCLAPDLHVRRRQRTPRTGMWSAPAESPLGPFDLDRAAPFEDPSIYAAHLVRLDGKRVGLLGFRDGHDDSFRGEIPAPVPVRINATGTLSRLVER